MEKEQLKEGLKRLDAYAKQLDFPSVLLEENDTVPMDSLVISLQMEKDLSIDISCNFVEIPEVGNILQFYGQIVLNAIIEESGKTISNEDILYLINALNRMIPIGQLLYLYDAVNDSAEKIIGIRYTMMTELDNEIELKKCAEVLMMLMQIYEILCSSLLLLIDGNSVETTLLMIEELLK